MTVETARWVDWRDPTTGGIAASRVYLGHETCEHLLPPPARARELMRSFQRAGVAVSLVTPPLKDRGIERALAIVEGMAAVRRDLEVIVSDWGLLAEIAHRGWGIPVAGRLLAAQHVDPRIARSLEVERWRGHQRRAIHLDGTPCRTAHRVPTDTLRRHLQRSWLDRPAVLGLLGSLGVARIELSLPGQGVELSLGEGWSCSLHRSDVLLTVMARCPGTGEDFGRAPVCDPGSCGRREIPWQLAGWEAPVFRRGNALFYRPAVRQADLERFDRIVVGPGEAAVSTGS